MRIGEKITMTIKTHLEGLKIRMEERLILSQAQRQLIVKLLQCLVISSKFITYTISIKT